MWGHISLAQDMPQIGGDETVHALLSLLRIQIMSDSVIFIQKWKRSIILSLFASLDIRLKSKSFLLPFVAVPNFEFIVTFMSRVINSCVHSTDNPWKGRGLASLSRARERCFCATPENPFPFSS